MEEWEKTFIDVGNGKIPEEVKKHRYWRIELTADPDKGMKAVWFVADTRFETMDERERHSPLPREEHQYDWHERKA